jgi:hypothetical protein
MEAGDKKMMSYTNYTEKDYKKLRSKLLRIEICNEAYSPFMDKVMTSSSIHQLYLGMISYANQNPGDVGSHTMYAFKLIFDEDITDLPLLINRGGLVGTIANWRLKVGK